MNNLENSLENSLEENNIVVSLHKEEFGKHERYEKPRPSFLEIFRSNYTNGEKVRIQIIKPGIRIHHILPGKYIVGILISINNQQCFR